MGFRQWSKSETEYGRKTLKSGIEGARSGGETFLNGVPLTGFPGESIRAALPPATAGACLGLLRGCSGDRSKSIGTVLKFGLLGGAIGLGVSLAWKSRRLTASAAYGASQNIQTVRDERWMKKNFVAYA
jgi:hypothetical protein